MTIKRQGGNLKQWFVFQYPTGEKVVIGIVTDDDYWWNGEVLRTSPIVTLADTYVETMNTVYQLGEYFCMDDIAYLQMLTEHGLTFYQDYQSVVDRSNLP